MNPKIKSAFLIAAALLTAAPLWLPSIQQALGQHFFLTSRSLVLLGATLAGGFAAARFLSDSVVDMVDRVGKRMEASSKYIFPILAILLLGAVMFVNQYVLNSFLNSGDEHSCYFLAECIRMGKFWATPHPHHEFFEVVHVGSKGGKWFSVYPPGWPLLFAGGLQFHIADWINPMLGILAAVLFFKAGKRYFGFSTAFLAVNFMAMTPFFLFHSASYFSHSTALVTVAVFIYYYSKWSDDKSIFSAFLCAGALGYGLNTRYLTLAAIAFPFLFYEWLRLVKKKERWTESHLVFVLVLSVFILFTFYYNYLITGNLFDAPNHYLHRWERLGFHNNYTLLHAVQFAIYRFFFLMDWIPPIFPILFLASLFRKDKFPTRVQLLRWGFWYLVIGYLFYYSWGGNQYGPRYYFEGIPFLFLTAHETICHWWREKNNWTKKFLIGILFASFLGNVYLLLHHGRFYQKVTNERSGLYELAQSTIQKPSVILINGFLGDTLIMAEEDAVRNHPSLRGKILYAHDLKGKNDILMEYYKDRDFYIGRYERKTKAPKLELIKKANH